MFRTLQKMPMECQRCMLEDIRLPEPAPAKLLGFCILPEDNMMKIDGRIPFDAAKLSYNDEHKTYYIANQLFVCFVCVGALCCPIMCNSHEENMTCAVLISVEC